MTQLTDQLIQKAIDLHANGVTWKCIAGRIGVSPGWLSTVVNVYQARQNELSEWRAKYQARQNELSEWRAKRIQENIQHAAWLAGELRWLAQCIAVEERKPGDV